MKPEKPLGIKNYGSIPHLSDSKLGEKDYHINEGQERILTEKRRDRHDFVIVTEKYDGSNVGVANIDGEIVAITRSGYLAKTSPYKQHHEFAEWVKMYEHYFRHILEDGERLAGEWMMQAHGMKYTIYGAPLIIFDIFDKENIRKSYLDIMRLDLMFGVKIPRILHAGTPAPVDVLRPILQMKTHDVLAHEHPEGMVYRVERKGKFDFAAKWVRSDYPTGRYLGYENNLTWNKIRKK